MKEPLVMTTKDVPLSGPLPSKWRCEMFGMGAALVYTPPAGKVPNAFWRFMQYICFGNVWKKDGAK